MRFATVGSFPQCKWIASVASSFGCMRNIIVFYSWTSQIVLQWLYEGCESDLSADFLHFRASDFPSKNPFKKCFKIVFFSLWRRDPVLELQFPTQLHVVLLCFWQLSLCRSHSNGCVKVASCHGILLSFVVGLHWSGCMKAATVICQQIFSILAVVIFLLKIRPHTRPSRTRRTAEVDHRSSGTDFVWKNIGFCASAISQKRISCETSSKTSSTTPPPAPLAMPFTVREQSYSCKSQCLTNSFPHQLFL